VDVFVSRVIKPYRCKSTAAGYQNQKVDVLLRGSVPEAEAPSE